MEGSGRELLASLLTGATPADDGSIRVNGAEVPLSDVRSAMAAGLALIPADRAAKGIVKGLSVRENIVLSRYTDVRRGMSGLFSIRRARERAQVDRWIETLDIRPGDKEQAVGALSGGNQQKVVLARALRLEPRVIVLDEPTQGVDVGARVRIYEQIADAARAGAAVVWCSSTDDELANECDRVFVMQAGHVSAELSGGALTEDALAAEALRTTNVRTINVTKDPV